MQGTHPYGITSLYILRTHPYESYICIIISRHDIAVDGTCSFSASGILDEEHLLAPVIKHKILGGVQFSQSFAS